jgi:hypothetical protein
MSDRIIFNGQEFDGIEAMPAEMRKQYEDVMRLLADSGQAPAGSKGPIGRIFNLKTNFSTRIVVNKKEYHSADELPPEMRAAYDRAVGGGGKAEGGVSPGALNPGRRTGISLPIRQVVFLLLGALIIAWWFLQRR